MGSVGKSGTAFSRESERTPLADTEREATTTEEEEKREETEEPKKEKDTFHYFYDKASGGWDYAGDGKHQVDWFAKHTNADAIISGMTSDEVRAFRDYWTPGHFMHGQQYGGFSSMSASDQRLTRIYDRVLDKATLDRGVTVVRRSDAQLLGLGTYTSASALRSHLDAMITSGATITSKGNMSTGAASQGLTIGSSSKNVEYRISIPKGSTGAGMWIGDSRINSWGPRQREFITSRDIELKPTGYKYDSKRKVMVVDMQYVRKLAHDYK